jgi:phosphate-selective porin OprO/OprP
MLLTACAFAQAPADSSLDSLRQEVRALKESNQQLLHRIEELEKRTQAAPPSTPVPGPTAEPAPSSPPPSGPEKVKGTPVMAVWDNGLRFRSADGAFKLKVGGRITFDTAFIDEPHYWRLGGDKVKEEDATEIRSMRLTLSGDVYKDYFYKFEMEFADGAEIVDAYMGRDNVPYAGTVVAGQFSEPMGLEALSSSAQLTFFERSMPTLALIPYRSRGVMMTQGFLDERLRLSLGAFNGGIDQDNYWSFTGRVFGQPWYEDDGRRLLHLGIAYSLRNPNGDYRFSTRPSIHLANKHLDTGNLPADDVDLSTAEAALVLGPLSLQGEYMRADMSFMQEWDEAAFLNLEQWFRLSDRHFDGWYVQASYILTGENRDYDPEIGAFEGVIPKHKLLLNGDGGWGAWELAARYEELSLNDFDMRSGVIGGEAENWTLGVNWYLTPNFKVMLNYVNSDIDQFSYDGKVDAYEARVQATF